MKNLTILIVSALLSVNLVAQIDEQQIEQKIAALEDSVKVKIEQYGGKHEEVVNAYFDLFDVLDKYAKYDEALGIAEKCLDVCLKILDEKNTSTATSYYNLGSIYWKRGEYSKALEYHQKALVIRLEILSIKDTLIATSLNQVGLVYYAIGDFEKALENYQKALNICLETLGENHHLVANIFSNIGSVYNEKDDYPKTLEYYEKSLSIELEMLGEKNSLTAITIDNIGTVYYKTGDYTKSLEYFKRAQSIRLEILGEKHNFTANSFNNIGVLHYKIGEYTKALEYYTKALEIQLELLGEKHPRVAISFNNIGKVYDETGDYLKAIEHHRKALAIYFKTLRENHPLIAKSFHNIGSAYNKIGNYTKALENYEKALTIRTDIFDDVHPDLIDTQISIAQIYKALTYLSKVDSLWNIIIPNLDGQLSKNYLFLANDKKIMYLKTIEDKFSLFYDFVLQNGSKQTQLMAADLLINIKSQILDYGISTRQLIENINDKILDSITFQLNSINQKVGKAELLTKEELKQKGWRLDSLRLQQDDLASQILEHPQLKAKLNPAKFSWQQIQGKLQADEALIDYFSFYDSVDSTWVYQAMLLKKDELKPIFIPLSLTKPVTDLLKTKNNFPIYLQYKEARQEMYAHIWKALEPYLENIKTIHLTPVASLNKIDFGSLQNEEGQFLADLYDFHYYTSFKDFYKQKPGKQNYKDVNLYGHIAYYEDDTQQYEAEEDSFALRLLRDTLVALPATLPEVNAIEEICSKHKISSTLLTINEAKEDTIEYFSGTRAPSIMHFATHGAYLRPLAKKEETSAMVSLRGEDRFRAADNPLQRSMLMLSHAGDNWKTSGPNVFTENDGILTALEVTNLDLSKTELVVLSACNSGIGSQHTTEGVFGLPRAFKLAGVDKILVSLWSVEDKTTKELMILFYTNLLHHKQEAATALRNAKAEMRKRDDRPKKWAGFVLVE